MRKTLLVLAMTSMSFSQAVADPAAEVTHWWTSPGESRAVGVLAGAYRAQGGEWIDSAVAGGANARAVAYNRIIGGNPPTASQFTAGNEMNSMVQQNLLRDVTPLINEFGYDKVLTPVLARAVLRDGHYYGLPVSMQVQNVFFYSLPVMKAAGVDVDALTDWPSFFDALDKVKAAGYVPLAFGVDPALLRHLFSVVLMQAGGRDLYTNVLGDNYQAALASPKFLKVAEYFLKLRTYTDEGAENRAWNIATNMVIKGEAGFQIIGDFAKGEITNAGMKPGIDVGCFSGPGERIYQIGSDVFVFPLVEDANHQEGQALLVKTLLEPKVQLDFAKAKGGLPIAKDFDVSQLDACAQKMFPAVLLPENQVPAPAQLVSPDVWGAVTDALVQAWSNPTSTAGDLSEQLISAIELAR
ncbi:carbohydrate ABC transporter substrate-binding protein [Agrobacterium sp. a22-2]|uniref:ABC transporter substrate-binding protein n=1 Tax=Agrobacterium sp. a22-2 TaxID=2283840 RepID=UPI0014450FBE|nr:ABC transporter substrate-binding protein [Agrobacterium sp. a22-2]NKN37447.1 carbohydrate ABC transporter substrate-binding protein [Agrobacterium sp. a22-2]